MSNRIANFGRNISLLPKHVFQPASGEELLEILNGHPHATFRAIGSLHCWSSAIETDSVLIDTSRLNSIEISPTGKTALVGGGCKIKDLLVQLDRHSLTLPSVGLIAEQSIAGATATGTHGAGKHCLSHYIESITVAHFDSKTNRAVMTSINHGDELRAAQCSLGLLGIIVSITIQCRDNYFVQEHAKKHDDLQSVLDLQSDYPLQQFYWMPWSWNYFCHHRVETNGPRSRLATVYRWYCFVVIDVSLHLMVNLLVKILKAPALVRMFFRNVLPLTIARNWKITDKSTSMLLMKHELFRHIEIEIFVQESELKTVVEYLKIAISVFAGLDSDIDTETKSKFESNGYWQPLQRHRGQYHHHYPICIRRVLFDNTLISMSSANKLDSDEDLFAISFISYQWPVDRTGFFKFADFVAQEIPKHFDVRCHWGKYNTTTRESNERTFPMLSRFVEVVHKFDRNGRFRNSWLSETLGLK